VSVHAVLPASRIYDTINGKRYRRKNISCFFFSLSLFVLKGTSIGSGSSASRNNNVAVCERLIKIAWILPWWSASSVD
jgi:hypothetical protein